VTGPLLISGDVSALRDLIAAAVAPLADDTGEVVVWDGPASAAVDRPYAARSVTVASAFEDDQEAVAFERVETGYARRRTETATVACSVYAGTGDTGEDSPDAMRQAAAEVLQAIDDGLSADPTLGGRVARMGIDAARWVQGIDEGGTGVYIGFTVVLTRLP
jgi:hypothetical protein